MVKTERLSRKELYDLIWTTPITRLSKQYCLSGVGLAKICKRNNIPRPPRGHWARLQSGQKVARTPLPDKNNDRIIEVNVNTDKTDTKNETTPFTEAASLSKLPKKIDIPDNPTEPHPLVAQTAEILMSHKPDNTGIVPPRKKGCLDIQVSPDNVTRALRIMDAVIKTFASLGHKVSTTHSGTVVAVLGMTVDIRMREELIHRHLRAKDHNLNKNYYEFGYKLFEEEFTPSGRLILEIIDPTPLWKRDYAQLQWRDTQAVPLEGSLRRFVSGLIRIAAKRKAKLLREQTASEGPATKHE